MYLSTKYVTWRRVEVGEVRTRGDDFQWLDPGGGGMFERSKIYMQDGSRICQAKYLTIIKK